MNEEETVLLEMSKIRFHELAASHEPGWNNVHRVTQQKTTFIRLRSQVQTNHRMEVVEEGSCCILTDCTLLHGTPPWDHIWTLNE